MGRVTRKTIAAVLAVLSLCALLLSGCQNETISNGNTEQTDVAVDTVVNTTTESAECQEEEETEPSDPKDVFWIVTDESVGKLMAEKIIDKFQAEHPEIQIKQQMLSSYDPSMTEGNGPDVFLLPAAQVSGEPLFADVNLAMRDGAFADISAYYDADTELDKEGLVTAIMDAGVVDGARYVLPLRYDMPVLYVDTYQLDDEGCTLEMLSGTIGELYDAVLASDNPKLAAAAAITDTAMSSSSLNFYPEIIDYDTREILVTAEEMLPLLQSVQKARAVEMTNKMRFKNPPTDSFLIGRDMEYWNDVSCYYIGGMDDLLSYGIYTCAYYAPGLTMLPVTAVDGSVVADVTYYGAVGAGSKNPELAYEFLRWFLTEEGQWQENEDVASSYIGWPVRAKGDIGVLARKYIANHSDTMKMLADHYRWSISDHGIQELPILDVAIDRVQFATNYEFKFKNEVVDLLNDEETGTVLEVDIEALVQALLDKVEQQLTGE